MNKDNTLIFESYKQKPVKKVLIAPIQSINDLDWKARKDPKYLQLALLAANNLGGSVKDLDSAIRWLTINASETDEQGVVDEINFCRDLVKESSVPFCDDCKKSKITIQKYANNVHLCDDCLQKRQAKHKNNKVVKEEENPFGPDKTFYNHNCLAVTDEDKKIIFAGTREECENYMRTHNNWEDLYYAWKENGKIQLGKFSSYVL